MRAHRSSRFLWSVAVLALAVLAATSARTQNQPPANPAPAQQLPSRPLQAGPGTIRSTVDLVQVDVTVAGRDGKPVKGLRQDQFSVAEDGHEQKIASFEYYDVEKIETAASYNSHGGAELQGGHQAGRPGLHHEQGANGF